MKFAPVTRPTAPARLAMSLALGLAIALLDSGCRVAQTAMNAPGHAARAVTPGKKDAKGVDPVEVQHTLLRFADEYSTRMILGVEKLRRGTNAPPPAEILQWKIVLVTETCSIASGPNAFANLLDMTVFVTVTRAALEDRLQANVFGESPQFILESCRNAESEIWRLAGKVLKPEQQAELRAAIEMWRRQNPLPESVLAARAVGFTSQVARANQADTAKPGSVFNLLMFDPLSGLDPATREIAETRLFAERALFVTQKMPTLLRWQTELLSVNTVELPVVQQLVSNSTQIAASVEHFARVAEQLPDRVSAEREEILKALQSQEKNLTPLVNEVRQTLTAGSQMSTSLNTTLTTFDALMKRFGVGEPATNAPPETNSPPFNILDYAHTAEKLATMATQLDILVKDAGNTLDSPALNKRLQDVGAVTERAKADAKSVLNHAFFLAAALVLLGFACALAYRRLSSRAP